MATQISKEEQLALRLGATKQLANFGIEPLSNKWLHKLGEVNVASTNLADRNISEAAFIMNASSIDQITAATLLLAAGPAISPLGLIGPVNTILRTQLETYWILHHLLKDPSTRHKYCTMYMLANAHLRYEHSLVEIESDRTWDEPTKAQKRKEADEQLDSILSSPHYDQAKSDYNDALGRKLYIDWYKVYRVSVGGSNPKKPTLEDLAKLAGDEKAYKEEYHHWSGVAHGLAPDIGHEAPSSSSTSGTRKMSPQEAVLCAGYIASLGIRTYTLLISTLLPEYATDYNNFLAGVTLEKGKSLAEWLYS